MAKSTEVSNALLDVLLKNDLTGSDQIGSLTINYPIYCKFLTTPSNADQSGVEWPTYGGYPQGGISISGLFASNASSGIKTNTDPLIVVNVPAGIWAGNEFVDSSTPTPIRLTFGPLVSLNKSVNAGDTCILLAGALSIQEQ